MCSCVRMDGIDPFVVRADLPPYGPIPFYIRRPGPRGYGDGLESFQRIEYARASPYLSSLKLYEGKVKIGGWLSYTIRNHRIGYLRA